jgi:1-acyl-sn-glycerol-3-phosphate acyltransferase
MFWIYYRKMTVQGIENVPATGAVILACNHPNSFLDAMVVGIFQRRRIHFLARSDVFNTPLKNWILSQLSMLPIYRLQEGMENLEKNKDTFARCHQILDEDGMILIFSEGLCIQEHRLRPLKKGTSRIALEYTRQGKSIAIVPMKPREEVMIDLAPSFQAEQLAADYSTNAGRAINEFNRLLLRGLQQVVIDFKDRAHDKEFAQILEIERNEGKELKDLVALAQFANDLSVANPAQYAALMKLASGYKVKLEELRLTDSIVTDEGSGSLLMPLLAPLYLVGFALNGLPWLAAQKLTKAKVKRPEFFDSVFLGSRLIFNITYQLSIFITLMFFSPLWAILSPLILLATAAISTVLHDPLQKNRHLLIKGRIPAEKLLEVKKMRRKIVEICDAKF